MAHLLHFLAQLRQIVRSQDVEAIRQWLIVGQDAGERYFALRLELQNGYPPTDLKSKSPQKDSLEAFVEKSLPIEDDVPEGQGTVWPSFAVFVKDYLAFWRDVDFNDLLGAHQMLSSLVK